MTAFQSWLKESVEKLIPDPTHAPSCAAHVDAPCDCGMVESTLPQRLAIGLVQARALECRALAAQMQMRSLQNNPDGAYLFTKLWDRSHTLEQIGLDLCKKYPPPDAAPSEEESAGPRLVQ